MRPKRSWALAPAGVAVALVMLLGTVTLGIRLRSTGRSDDLPNAAPLDYAAAPFGTFSQLSSSFITDVLGGVIGLPGRTPATDRPGRDVIPARKDVFERLEIAHALTNDDRSDAHVIPSVPFTARTDSRSATRESREVSACGVSGGSVWYRFTATRDIGLIANTFGSSYATALGVFEDTGRDVGCDTDLQGNAIVQFAARKGSTYFLQIAGPAGGGELVFSLDPDGVTELASGSSSGKPANASALSPSVSGNGRFVAFASAATNLSPVDTNGQQHIFLRDRLRSTITLVSVNSTGNPANGINRVPFVSGDGRFVVFESDATNLVPGDTNDARDVFVRDVLGGETERVSVSSEGEQAERELPTQWGDATADRALYNPEGAGADVTLFPTLTPDGRFVAFQSKASNLVPGDHNHVLDVFVHDRVTRVTERVSVSSTGRERGQDTNIIKGSNEDSMTPSISGNGRFVMFRTSAANLVGGDDNGSHDVFVHDRRTHTTQRIAYADAQLHLADDDQPRYAMNEIRPRQALSSDGRHVAFTASPRPTYGPAEANIFVHDRRNGKIIQANVSSTGAKAEDNSSTRAPAISADGRYVAFHSLASNLVPGDDNGLSDAFVHDLWTRTTVLLTVSTRTLNNSAICQGATVSCGSFLPSISANGRVVVFESGVFGGVGDGAGEETQSRPSASGARQMSKTASMPRRGSAAKRTQASKPLALLLVDDHPMWRDTLRNILAHAKVGKVVGEASDGAEAVAVARKTKPDVVVMDVNLPEMDGIEATSRVLAEHPYAKVLVLASSDERAQVIEAVRAGASGYVLKTAAPDEVVDAVRRVGAGELVFPSSVANAVLDELRGGATTATGLTKSQALDSLTAREREVLALMAEGHSNQAIMERLYLGAKTVEAHVRSIFSKLGLEPASDVNRRVRAVLEYLRST